MAYKNEYLLTARKGAQLFTTVEESSQFLDEGSWEGPDIETYAAERLQTLRNDDYCPLPLREELPDELTVYRVSSSKLN